MNQELAAELNTAGLKSFEDGNLIDAIMSLKDSYLNWAEEVGILVNLGLAFMQLGLDCQAERCYRHALKSRDVKTKRAAYKNLGFVQLWRGEWELGWRHHGKRFMGEDFEKNQWRGDQLNGKPLIIWNDVGIGDAFQFIRYTKLLKQRGEKVIFAVDKSQLNVLKKHLRWEIEGIVDRDSIMPLHEQGAHIPLMSLIGLVDPETIWGREFSELTWDLPSDVQDKIGLCWRSNSNDKTMFKYKSKSLNALINDAKISEKYKRDRYLSLQANELEEHKKYNLDPPTLDWIDTLGRISTCKTVYSVDTAVAHLAAGSGIPVQLHLGNVYDWRWKGSQPNWYPSIEINQFEN